MYCWSGLASGKRFCITLERTIGFVLLEEKDDVSESSIDWLLLLLSRFSRVQLCATP